MKYYFIGIVLFYIAIPFVKAQKSINFKSEEELISLGKSIYFLEDKEGKLTIQEILKEEKQEKFQKNNKFLFNQTATASAYWIKFKVNNHTDKDIWLALNRSFILLIDFYAPDNSGNYTKAIQTGALRPFEQRPYSLINGFWLPLNKANDNQTKTYYIRIKSHFALDLPLQIGTLSKLHQQKTRLDNLSTVFIGLMFIMILYNSFLSVITKDKIYFFYTGYLFFITLVSTFLNSYPIVEYFTAYQIQFFWHDYFSVWFYPVMIFSVFFCIHYLDLKNNLPKAESIIKWVLLSYLIVIFLNLTNLSSLWIIVSLEQLIPLAINIACITTAFYLFFFKKLKRARYYLLGWSFFFIGVIFLIASSNGLITFNIYLRNATYFGTAMEVWMFSLALGDRVKFLQKENEKIQAKNLALVKEQKEVLEQKVKNRTKQLEENNEKLELNQKKLQKNKKQLQKSLEDNKIYLEQIQHQKQDLQEKNKELLAIEEELRQSNEVLEQKVRERTKKIKEQSRNIEQLYKDLSASVSYARRIQQAILPTQEKFNELIPESFVFFKPRNIVSGDFYFLAEVKGKLVIAAVDCTGHGVPGAFMSLIGNDLLTETIKNREILEPKRILENLHTSIHHLLRQKETKNQDGMDVALVVIDKENKILEFAGAKNPLIYVQKNNLYRIRGDILGIGGEEEERKFTLHTIDISQLTTIYLFSDGFQDQFGGGENKKFMSKTFRELLFEIHQKPMEEQKTFLEEKHQDWRGTEVQTDDILVIGVKI